MISRTILGAGAVSLLLALGPAALAAKPPNLESVLARLNVTPESEPIVEPVISDNLERYAAIKRNARAQPGGADPARVQSELDAERARSSGRLEGVLDQSQMDEWSHIQDELDADVMAGVKP